MHVKGFLVRDVKCSPHIVRDWTFCAQNYEVRIVVKQHVGEFSLVLVRISIKAVVQSIFVCIQKYNLFGCFVVFTIDLPDCTESCFTQTSNLGVKFRLGFPRKPRIKLLVRGSDSFVSQSG